MTAKRSWQYLPEDFGVTLKVGEHPGLPPRAVYTLQFEVSPGGRKFEESVLVSELLDELVTHPEGHRDPYALEVKASLFSWGASSFAVDVCLYILGAAASGVAGHLTVASLQSLITRLKPIGSPSGALPDDEWAVGHAKHRIALAYDVHAEDLSLVGERRTVEPPSHGFTFETGAGAVYEVRFLLAGGGLVTETAWINSHRQAWTN